MSEKTIHHVRIEPMGLEIDVEEGEWVLDAAFRQGLAVPHGCREGRCASCKCVLVDGDVEMEDYSTFALSETERDGGQILLCRTYAYSDITVELLNKRPSDTVENADKTGILRDMVLDVVSLDIDDINLGPLLHSVSEYRPIYPDHYSGDPVIRDCVTMGWNGVWSIRWTNPFYIWLLESL